MSEQPRIDPRFVVDLGGKEYPTWPAVLDLAHQIGLESIRCELIQVPAEENAHTAIIKATARLKDGRECSDYGDANPRNCNAKIATALIRMASTRAKGRALRDLTNIGTTLLEELPDLDDAPAPMPGNGKARAQAAMERNEQPVPVVAKPAAAISDQRSATSSEPIADRRPPIAAPAPAADYDWDLCSEPGCGKPLTEGMKNTSRANWKKPLCPVHQKAAMEAKKAAQG